jgi:hypothetical protein
MIEALAGARRDKGVGVDDVASLEVLTNPRWLSVCDIKRPRTGLEIKFSYAWLSAMVLSGIDTARDATYTDELARDERLADFATRVTVTPDTGLSDMQARCTLTLRSNETLSVDHDLAAPIPPDVLEENLGRKAAALLGDREGELLRMLALGNETGPAADLGRALGTGETA